MAKTKCREALQNEISKMDELLRKKEITSEIKHRVLQTITKQFELVKKHAHVKKRQQSGSNRNSGLEKPMRITQELVDFAGWDSNEEKSRVDITRFICSYIKEHDLQNTNNKKEIILNDALATLLKVEEPTITYPHIQKHLHHLIIKPEVPEIKSEEQAETDKETDKETCEGACEGACEGSTEQEEQPKPKKEGTKKPRKTTSKTTTKVAKVKAPKADSE